MQSSNFDVSKMIFVTLTKSQKQNKKIRKGKKTDSEKLKNAEMCFGAKFSLGEKKGWFINDVTSDRNFNTFQINRYPCKKVRLRFETKK